jgi:hypothetical protein
MNSISKGIIGVFAGLCALWDAFTTYGGMYDVVVSKPLALIFTFIINGAIIISFVKKDNDVIKFILGIVIIVATICDLYTAFNGNRALMQGSNASDAGQIIVSLALTVISVGCSFLVSYLLFGDEKSS